MRRYLLSSLILIIYLLPQASLAQISTYEDQVRQEILRRGLDENELKALLFEKGIDLDNLQSLSPDDIAELERSIEELQQITILRELQDVTDSTDVQPDQAQEIDTVIEESEVEEIDTFEFAVFGHQYGNISLLEPEGSYVPGPGYKLGPGDALSITIFGNTAKLDRLLTIGSNGELVIWDGNVRVFIAGLTLEEARRKLIRNFRRFIRFADTDFNLRVASARTVSVQVFGEIITPGTYTISGLNSVLNVIGASGGFTDNASIRNIRILKSNGEIQAFDLYDLISDPSGTSLVYLDDGDLVHVPSLGAVVEMTGAVARPHTYELLPGESIFDAVQYAGGLDRGAYLTNMTVARYEDNRRVIRTIPYAELLRTNQTFELLDGDAVVVNFIEEAIESYVSIQGAVRNQGDFERTENMRVSDLLAIGVLKPGARRDFAYLRRTNPNGTTNMIPVSLDIVLSGIGTPADLELIDKDELTVWESSRFTDDKFVTIAGAVRFEERISYDEGGTLKVADAIRFAGGLRRDAAEFAHVHRLDPLNPNDLQYFRVDLLRLISNSAAPDNIVLEPFDSIFVYSKNDFLDEVTIRVAGAVNNPGEFAFGEGMNLKDAITLAGGFQRSSATNRIEVSRVLIRDNEPTSTVVETVSLDRNQLLNFDDSDNDYSLEPYDNIFVRYVPQFELQQNVTIEGEVVLPGEYSLIKDNETVFDIIQRAEGLTDEAFSPAASLRRTGDTLALWVMALDEVLEDPNSKFNYVLKDGDVINIPKRQDWVTIVGATQYLIQQPELRSIRTPFHRNENAEFYIDTYAGGFADNARTDKIFVKYANGQVKSTQRKFPFGKKHPEILPGSEIQIGEKPRDLNANKDEENVNWTKVLGDSVAQAMSILTLILLVQRLD